MLDPVRIRTRSAAAPMMRLRPEWRYGRTALFSPVFAKSNSVGTYARVTVVSLKRGSGVESLPT